MCQASPPQKKRRGKFSPISDLRTALFTPPHPSSPFRACTASSAPTCPTQAVLGAFPSPTAGLRGCHFWCPHPNSLALRLTPCPFPAASRGERPSSRPPRVPLPRRQQRPSRNGSPFPTQGCRTASLQISCACLPPKPPYPTNTRPRCAPLPRQGKRPSPLHRPPPPRQPSLSCTNTQATPAPTPSSRSRPPPPRWRTLPTCTPAAPRHDPGCAQRRGCGRASPARQAQGARSLSASLGSPSTKRPPHTQQQHRGAARLSPREGHKDPVHPPAEEPGPTSECAKAQRPGRGRTEPGRPRSPPPLPADTYPSVAGKSALRSTSHAKGPGWG